MLIKVNMADMKFYKYLRERVQIPKEVSAEGLVTFTNHNDHFDVDHNKSDRLP